MAGVDRDFWLDFAKDNVPKSINSREEAAEKLDDFLAWVWTIYTGVFALASFFDYISDSIRQLIAVTQPILVIMVARFFCRRVSMPSVSNKANADPNVVPEVIDAFKFIVEDKKGKLITALVWTVVSMVSICIALIGYNVFDPDKVIKHEISQLKLKKELHDQRIEPINPQQTINDSLKRVNEYYDLQIQNKIKKRKLDCLNQNNKKCLDSLSRLEK